MKNTYHSLKVFSILLLFFMLVFSQVNAQNWFASGSQPDSYDMGGDPTVAHGDPGGGYIISNVSSINGFGTWMTSMEPGNYAGKGIKLTVYIQTTDVDGWVGMWMRVDGDGGILAFDNMWPRRLQGTNDWSAYQVILDVPENADQISYGLLLGGTGEAHFDGLVLEKAPRTWEMQQTGISGSIFCVDAIDENTVWAGAAQGQFLRTTDAGENWIAGTIPGATGLNLLSIAGIDENVAYVAGTSFGAPDVRIYKTIDAGETWEMQYQNTTPAAFINGIAFWDENTGMAISDAVDGHFLIVRTTDGGETWEEIPESNIPPPLPGEWAGFGDAGGTCLGVAGIGHAWFGTATGSGGNDPIRIFRTTDQGETWEVVDTDLSNEGQYRGIRTFAFKDSLTGFAGSSSGSSVHADTSNHLVKTTDGGISWEKVTSFLPMTPGTIVYVPQSLDSMLFVTSDQGSASSGDGGLTWSMRSTELYTGLSFASPSVGWATDVTSAGRIVKFIGGGEVISSVSEVSMESRVPVLDQNYPNPFTLSTTIGYEVLQNGLVSLKIFTINGVEVATLVNEHQLAGKHQIEWQSNGIF